MKNDRNVSNRREGADDAVERLRALDAQAQRRPAARVDVTAGVLRAIAAEQGQIAPTRAAGAILFGAWANRATLEWSAVAAMAMAAAVTALAWQALTDGLDPLHGIFSTFAMGMP
ncbi:MAG: hypothetical protein NTW19_05535 [Planctomycetota bacterium]|nr:hypothetical protein [Planctomycetota bacterium]